jgi:hypothetical protein
MVLLNVHVRLALGGPEYEPSEPLNLHLVDDASNVLNVNGLLLHLIHQPHGLFVVLHVFHLSVELLRDLWKHSFCYLKDLEAVLEFVK